MTQYPYKGVWGIGVPGFFLLHSGSHQPKPRVLNATPQALDALSLHPKFFMAKPEVETEPVDEAATWCSPNDLVPWPQNPKKYTAEDIRKTCQSIKRFGFGPPIVARRENREIIAGHRRTLAALKLRLDRVPVRFLDLTESEAHKMAVADNRHGRDKKQDPGLLAELLNEWHDEGDELDGLGFDDGELSRILGDSLDESEVEELDVSAAHAEFFLSVSGPLTMQIAALEKLKQALSDVDGLSVELSVTEA